MTWTLLGCIAGVYLLQLIALGYAQTHPQFFWHGRVMDWHKFLFEIGPDWMWRPWSLVTSTFSHDPIQFTHILFNGMFLFFLGPSVERLVGGKRYAALFLVAGALSGILQVHLSSWVYFDHQWFAPNYALGASGALMALFGVLMMLTPKSTILLMFFPVPMWLGGIIYAAIDILGVLNPGGIGNFAHLSGLALGMLFGSWAKADFKKRGLRIMPG